jgi:hypothetical protein
LSGMIKSCEDDRTLGGGVVRGVGASWLIGGGDGEGGGEDDDEGGDEKEPPRMKKTRWWKARLDLSMS